MKINIPKILPISMPPLPKLPKVVILIITILSLILVVGYLTTHPQIFKSKAAVNTSDAFEITDDQGNPIYCENNVCTVHSLNLKIKIKDTALLNK